MIFVSYLNWLSFPFLCGRLAWDVMKTPVSLNKLLRSRGGVFPLILVPKVSVLHGTLLCT